MDLKFPRLWLLLALLLSLSGCFRPAGDVIEPTANTEPLAVASPLPAITAESALPATEEAEIEPTAALSATEEEGEAEEAEADPATPTRAAAQEDDAPESDGTPRLAITIIPPATSTSASDARASLEQTAAVTTPTATVIFTTPRIPAGPFTPEPPARSAFTDGTEEAGAAESTPSGLITPTDFFDPNDEACFYTVESGDNLYRIALANGFSEAEMREANPELAGANPILQPGQQLRLPGCGVRTSDDEEDEPEIEPTAVEADDEPDDLPAGGEVYVVTFGDTLTTIANRFGVSVQQIIAANDLDNPDRLQVGQELIIPPSE
jgi:LysM repeat protein